MKTKMMMPLGFKPWQIKEMLFAGLVPKEQLKIFWRSLKLLRLFLQVGLTLGALGGVLAILMIRMILSFVLGVISIPTLRKQISPGEYEFIEIGGTQRFAAAPPGFKR